MCDDPILPKDTVYGFNDWYVGWGFKLIKYDFVTSDIFRAYGFRRPEFMYCSDMVFHDRTLTTAEIILNLYKTIRKAAKDALLIGCNTIGHLCAGLFEINRTGDDTSGKEWERTGKMGINTLVPIDRMEKITPEEWLLNGEKIVFKWE